MRRVVVCLAASLVACAGSYAPTELPAGRWGGEHVSMTVTAASVSLEFDCAHGAVDEPALVDPEGRFNLRGVYVREHGGPGRDGEVENRHAVLYVGRFEGSQVTLSIRLDEDATQIGPFEAWLGRQPSLYKCL